MKSFLKSFLASFLATVIVLFIIVMVIGMVAVSSTSGKKEKIEDGSWLVVDLYGGITEYSPPAGVMSEVLGGKGETLQRILDNMEKVCVDDRIEGVILKMSSSNGAGGAMLEEMRWAVKKVQESGKKVYGYSDSMDRKTYYLASACDSIFMPRTGYMTFLGYSVTTEHVLGTLEKLGINPNIHKIKDYKAAAEMVIRKDMSSFSRENKEWMLDEYWDLFCEAVESDRGMTEEKVREAMDLAVLTPAQALEIGMIDATMYWDEMEEILKNEGDEKLPKVSQGRYEEEEAAKLGLKGKKKIAVVHAQGMIGGRKSRIDPMFGIMMGHETVAAEIRRAQKDDDISAIVFRVDSPGGESLASDMIGHQIEVAAGVKPVVVSMVDVAASGGYHISYRATKIVADRTTLTGSIGSISGKFNAKGFYDKLGITHDFATKGPRALMFSPYDDFNEEEWKIFKENHWMDFNAWLRDVSEHRGMTFEEAEKLAHGRVWTGRQGKENGLVDELGGLDRAIELAKELAEIPADEKVTIVHYPVKKSFFEELTSGGGLAAAARYVVYRYIKDDLAETWDIVTQRRMYVMEGMEAN